MHKKQGDKNTEHEVKADTNPSTSGQGTGQEEAQRREETGVNTNTAAYTTAIDTHTVMFVIYLLYINNFISTHNLRQVINSIKRPLPDKGVIEWLLKEVGSI